MGIEPTNNIHALSTHIVLGLTLATVGVDGGILGALLAGAGGYFINRASDAASRIADDTERQRAAEYNKDLVRAQAASVRTILHHAIHPGPNAPKRHASLEPLRDLNLEPARFEAAWLAVASCGEITEFPALSDRTLADRLLPEIAHGRVTENTFPAMYEEKAWRLAVARVLIQLGGDAATLGNPEDPTTCPGLSQLATACDRGFGYRFYQQIKNDFIADGRAFASVHLRMMGEVVARAREDAGTLRDMQRTLEALLARVAELTERFLRSQPDEVTRKRLDVFVAWLVKLDVKLIRIQQGVDAANTKLDAQGEMLKLVVDFIDSQKKPGVDPISQAVPADVLDAAKELLKSKDVRKRVLGAAAERIQNDAVTRDIESLKNAPANHATHQNMTVIGDYWFALGEFDKSIPPYEAAFVLKSNDPKSRNNLAIACMSARQGNLSARRTQAIDLLTGTLLLADLPPNERAGAMINLGSAWMILPTADINTKYYNTFQYLYMAMDIFTRETNPLEWARIQHNLGVAWQELPTGQRDSNLWNSIECLTDSLTKRTMLAVPRDWAASMTSLANAWSSLGEINSDEQAIRTAYSCLDQVLAVMTPSTYPVEWCIAMHNFGLVWQDMPGDKASNLSQAIECFENALTVRTRTEAPEWWAMTMNNLGNAWAEMPNGFPRQNLERAIAAYESALQVRTQHALPMGWAQTHHNLAMALVMLCNHVPDQRRELLCRAIASGKAAMSVRSTVGGDVGAMSDSMIRQLREWYDSMPWADGDLRVPFDSLPTAT